MHRKRPRKGQSGREGAEKRSVCESRHSLRQEVRLPIEGRELYAPDTASFSIGDRVEAESPDGDDPEEDEEHEHDQLRLLERRLGFRRRERVDQMANFAKYASVTPDTPLSRVEARSPDGNDPEEDEEHEHDQLRLLERRLGLRRRNQQVTSLLESNVDQMAHFAKYASVTPDPLPSRVEARSPDGNDPEEDEEHEHDELRLLERRLGLCRRDQYELRLSSNQRLTKWHTLQSMRQ